MAFVHDVAHYRREVHTRFVTEMHDQGASGGADAEGSITCAAVDEEHNRVALRVVDPDQRRRTALGERRGPDAICIRAQASR